MPWINWVTSPENQYVQLFCIDWVSRDLVTNLISFVLIDSCWWGSANVFRSHLHTLRSFIRGHTSIHCQSRKVNDLNDVVQMGRKNVHRQELKFKIWKNYCDYLMWTWDQSTMFEFQWIILSQWIVPPPWFDIISLIPGDRYQQTWVQLVMATALAQWHWINQPVLGSDLKCTCILQCFNLRKLVCICFKKFHFHNLFLFILFSLNIICMLFCSMTWES